jgi:hypothetical protein
MLVSSRDPAAIGVVLARVLAAPPAATDLRQRVAHLTWDASLGTLERFLQLAVREKNQNFEKKKDA